MFIVYRIYTPSLGVVRPLMSPASSRTRMQGCMLDYVSHSPMKAPALLLGLLALFIVFPAYAQAAPTATLTASPSSVANLGYTTLTWSSTGAASCTGNGFYTGEATSGSASVQITYDRTFSVTCNATAGPGCLWTYESSEDRNPNGQSCTPNTACYPSNSVCRIGGGGSHDVYRCVGTCAAETATASAPVTVTRADVVVGAVSPAYGVAGTLATYSATVTNQGSAATGASFPNTFWIDTDTNLGNGQVAYIGSTANPLGPGSSVTRSIGYTFSSPGTYYMMVCTDNTESWGSSITESNEGNNCGPWTAISVGSVPPVPSVTLSSNPISIFLGNSSTLSWSSNNAGSCIGTNFDTNGATSGSLSVSPSATTNYSIQCLGNVASGVGTWVYQASDITDFSCPVGNANRAYTNMADCPTANPTGAACSSATPRCKHNVVNGCNIDTTIYRCDIDNAPDPATASDSEQITVTSQPNLSAGGTSNASYNPGGAQWLVTGTGSTFSATVSNTGNAIATNFPNVFQIADFTLSATIAMVAGQTHTLGASGSTGITGAYTFATPATYKVRACSNYNTNWGGSVAESSTADNCGAWTDYIVTPRAPTGLTHSCNASGVATLSWTAPSGGASSYYVRISPTNGGSCPAGWQLAWGTTCIPNPDSVSGTSIAFGALFGQTYSWSVYGKNSGGEYGPPTSSSFTCSGSPDLSAGATTPTTAIAGVASTLSSTVSNTGNATATNFPNVFQVADATLSSTIAMVSAQTHTLGTGGSTGVSASYTFPSATTYQIRACANYNTVWGGSVAESSTANNCGGWTVVTVSAPAQADLTASVATPTSATSGVSTTFSSTVSNTGTASAGASVTSIWIMTAANGGGSLIFNNDLATPVIASGASSVRTGAYTFPSAGTYSVRFCADNTTAWVGTISESDEADNCGTWANITVTAPVPPPVTADLTASPTTVVTGAAATLTWSSTNAASCSGAPGFNTGGSANGSVPTVPLSLATCPSGTCAYQVTCGTASDTATVSVLTPTASISAAPDRVRVNTSTAITWTTAQCTNVSVTRNGTAFSSAPQAASVDSQLITGQTTFTVDCDSGAATASVIVNVVPQFEEF